MRRGLGQRMPILLPARPQQRPVPTTFDPPAALPPPPESDAWEVIGLVVSVPIACMYATHATIAAAARERVPATVYSGLVVAVLSSWLYVRSFFG